MRLRVLLLAVPLLFPPAADAQLRPRTRTGASDPTRPLPQPEPVEPVARVLAYQRQRLAVETYPQAMAVYAPGFSAVRDGWTSIGWGARADYRVTDQWSAVGESTTSWVGSPVSTFTLELGARYRPPITRERVLPFIDMRLGWTSAWERMPTSTDGAFPMAATASGLGAVAGVGMEYLLTPRWSALTGAALAHSAMRTHASGFDGTRGAFGMTTARGIVGLRYNRIRMVLP